MKAAFVACSDPMLLYQKEDIKRLQMILEKESLAVTVSPYLFENFRNPSGKEKADDLLEYFNDPEMDFIFDVSGGDIANSVLTELDYDVISKSRAVFCGYSDLTTVLNGIYTQTRRETVNYQIRNLLYDHAETAQAYFREHILKKNITADDLEYKFLRGDAMKGRVLGGNIRCFLKLAGTPFWPDLNGAILLLEAYSGSVMKMTTYLHQLKQMGVFEKIGGILLGTFSEMEEKQLKPTMEELVLSIVPSALPIAATRYIGHRTDARAIVIGREYIY
ncbi:MAG: LD-carboxypeptidase [Lachnospiraceae bacterium]|nr:LD-carboxypeptidase [Lachnospiraceae bacterium]